MPRSSAAAAVPGPLFSCRRQPIAAVLVGPAMQQRWRRHLRWLERLARCASWPSRQRRPLPLRAPQVSQRQPLRQAWSHARARQSLRLVWSWPRQCRLWKRQQHQVRRQQRAAAMTAKHWMQPPRPTAALPWQHRRQALLLLPLSRRTSKVCLPTWRAAPPRPAGGTAAPRPAPVPARTPAASTPCWQSWRPVQLRPAALQRSSRVQRSRQAQWLQQSQMRGCQAWPGEKARRPCGQCLPGRPQRQQPSCRCL